MVKKREKENVVKKEKFEDKTILLTSTVANKPEFTIPPNQKSD